MRRRHDGGGDGKIFEPFFSPRGGKGRASACRPPTASSSRRAAISSPTAKSARAPPSVSTCRATASSHEDEIASAREEEGGDRDLTGTGRGLLVEARLVRNFAAPRAVAPGYEVAGGGTGVEPRVMSARRARSNRRQRRDHAGDWNGPTLLKELRKTNPGSSSSSSGLSRRRLQESLDDNEAYSFLPKPFTLSQLAAGEGAAGGSW